MSFLKLKKSQISSAYDTSPAILPVQNVYSPHLRLSNPSLIHDAIPQRRERFDSATKERDHRRETVMKEAEEFAKKRRKHNIYSRMLCCACFPCLPMWTRTICCFLFLGVFGFSCLVMFFFLSFKKPQILFNGSNRHISTQTNQSTMEFEYSIYNNNFFELNFENLRFVTYYPTKNTTTIGVGEISNMRLGPQAVTNVTIPVKVVGEDENAFENMVIELCTNQKNTDIVISVDIMPTIRFLNNHVISLSFKGQKSTVSCNKLLHSTVSNNLIDNFQDVTLAVEENPEIK